LQPKKQTKRAFNLRRHFKKRTMVILVIILLLISVSFLLKGTSSPKSMEIRDELSSTLNARGQSWNGTQLEIVKYEIENLSDQFVIRYEKPVSFLFIRLPIKILDDNPEYFLIRFTLKGDGEFVYGIRINKVLDIGPNPPFVASPTVYFSYSGKDRPDFLRINAYNLKDYPRNSHSELITDSIEFFTATEDFKHAYVNLVKEIHFFEFRAVYATEGLVKGGIIDDQSLLLSIASYIGLMVVFPIIFLSLGALKFKRLLDFKWVILVGLLIRFALSTFTAHSTDMEINKFAVRTFYENGEIALFSNWTSPPIFYFSLIFFYAPYAILHYCVGFADYRVFFLPVRAVESLFIKMPMMFADVLIFAFLLKSIHYLKPNLSKDRSVLLGSLYFLNPFVIMISSVWGMFDALAVVFIIAGIYMWAKEKPLLSGSLFAISAVTKWIGVAPLLFETILLLRAKRFRTAFQVVVVGITIILSVLTLPFIIAGKTDFLLEVLSFRLGQGSDITRWYGMTYLEYFGKLDVFHILPDFLVSNYFLIIFGIFGISLCLTVFRSRWKDQRADTFALVKFTLLSFVGFYLTYQRINEQFLIWSIALVPLILLEDEKIRYSISNWLLVVTVLVLGWAMMETITGQTLTYMLVGFTNSNFALQPQGIYQASFSLVFSFLCVVLVWRLSGVSNRLGDFLFREEGITFTKKGTKIVVYSILLLSLYVLTWIAVEAANRRIDPLLVLASTIYLFVVVAPLTAVTLDRRT
jgi:Gpi18-like mannosyltransferase